MAMGRPKAELVLSDEEQAQLQALVRSRSLRAALVRRANMVLACAAGATNTAVARRFATTKWASAAGASSPAASQGEPAVGAPLRHHRGAARGAAPIPGDLQPNLDRRAPWLPDPSGHQSGTARAAPDRRMNQPRGVSQLWTATFSSGFRSAVVGDQKYEFTKKQAEVVEVLFEAFESGLHKMHQDEIMGSVDSSQRIGQLFHGHPAYGTLISGDHNGYYWLAL
jgi:hypothetical protein